MRIALCKQCALEQKAQNGHTGYGDHVKLCGARNRNKPGTCGLAAGAGTDHPGYGRCKYHGGCTPIHRRAAAKAQAAEIIVAGDPIDLHPLDALLNAVRIAAGEVNFFTTMIHTLTHDQASVRHEKTRPLNLGKEGEDSREVVSEKTTDAELHIWIRARQDALDRLVKYSKTALDAGIDERRVKMAEQTGSLIVKALTYMLENMQLSAKQRELAPSVVREALTVIEGTAVEKESVAA